MGTSGGDHPPIIEWTPEREALLVEMVTNGAQYRHIAERLGIPGHANACISKARRLRIGGKRRQPRNPGRRISPPPEPVPETPPPAPRLAVLGFQLRRLPWEPPLDKLPGAPHTIAHYGAES